MPVILDGYTELSLTQIALQLHINVLLKNV